MPIKRSVAKVTCARAPSCANEGAARVAMSAKAESPISAARPKFGRGRENDVRAALAIREADEGGGLRLRRGALRRPHIRDTRPTRAAKPRFAKQTR